MLSAVNGKDASSNLAGGAPVQGNANSFLVKDTETRLLECCTTLLVSGPTSVGWTLIRSGFQCDPGARYIAIVM